MVRELLLVAAGFLGITLIVTWPVAARLSTSLPAGLGDPLLNAWTLAWGSDRLAHGLQGFWTPPAFYPYRGALAYSENLLGISLLVAPVQWVGQNPVLTYNVAFLLSYVIAGTGMYLLAREVTGRRDAALVAAAIYAFCPYRAAQVTHLQVLMSGWLPIALWALHRFLATARLGPLGVFLAAFFLQGLSNTYSIVFALVPIAAIIGWSAWTRRGSARAFRVLAFAGVALVAMMVPIVLRYAEAWRGTPASLREIIRYSARLDSFVQVPPEIRYARLLPGPGPDEGNFFPGFIAVALLAAAIVGWGRASHRASETGRGIAWAGVPYVAAGFVGALLSLGPLPYAGPEPIPVLGWAYQALLAMVPGFGVLRVPARFATVSMLAVSVIAGLGAARLLALPGATWRRIGGMLLLLGILAEGYAGPVRMSDFSPFRDGEERAAYTALRHRPPAPMLELPLGGLALADQPLVFQAAALFHRHPVVNGFSRRGTPLQDLLGSSASPFAMVSSVGDGLQLLRGLGVQYLVIHPRLYRDSALAEGTIQAAEADPAVAEAWSSPGIAVFRLRPRQEPTRAVGNRVPSDRIVAHASRNEAEVSRALDGDITTRWTTGHSQDGTEWLDLSFDRPRDLARFDIALGASIGDYPRDLEIEAVEENGSTRSVYRGALLPEVGAGLARDTDRAEARLPLAASHVKGLRLRQRGTCPGRWWSIHEIQVWEK